MNILKMANASHQVDETMLSDNQAPRASYNGTFNMTPPPAFRTRKAARVSFYEPNGNEKQIDNTIESVYGTPRDSNKTIESIPVEYPV